MLNVILVDTRGLVGKPIFFFNRVNLRLPACACERLNKGNISSGKLHPGVGKTI